jgi:CTP synthase
MALVHISLVPTPGDEQKTKPTQHSVKLLSTLGLFADFVGCRCDQELQYATKKKIANFCNINPRDVISLHNVADIWSVPLILHDQKFLRLLVQKMGTFLPSGKPDLTLWRSYLHRRQSATQEVKIAIVAKYTGMNDTYLSVLRALQHAASDVGVKLISFFVNSGHLDYPK